jgi:hypothetical protein
MPFSRDIEASKAVEGQKHCNDADSGDNTDHSLGADLDTPDADFEFMHDSALHLKNMKSESFCQGVLSGGGIRQIVSNSGRVNKNFHRQNRRLKTGSDTRTGRFGSPYE